MGHAARDSVAEKPLRPMQRMRGFTLLELVMVLLLVGVLAVFVAPRFEVAVFNARGFADQVGAALRFAQKAAIARRQARSEERRVGKECRL